jgi:hypothetical protein
VDVAKCRRYTGCRQAEFPDGLAFDTLGCAKHPEEAVVDRQQAEAHAFAAREFIMAELVTKADRTLALEDVVLKTTIALGSVVVASAAALRAFLKLSGVH